MPSQGLYAGIVLRAKLSISIIQCPRCGYVILARDMDDSQVREGRCPRCELEIEVVYDEFGNLQEVKPISIN